MALSSTRELLDDNTKLEPKVVLALSRLSKSNKSRRSTGVACKQIVEYLIANYCNLDGDIESQVLTALLSCVRSGIVCALDNGKYLLPGPGSKGVISKCITRGPHGSKCSCSSTLKRISKTYQNACCVLKVSSASTKKGKKTTTKSTPSSKPKKRTVCSTKPRKCAQAAQHVLEERDTCAVRFAEEIDSKCEYCLEIHTLQSSTSQKLCSTCHPTGMGYSAPFDKFSPREEHM